ITKFNSDLANTLGNLVNRSIAMTNKYFNGKLSAGEPNGEFDLDLINTVSLTTKKYFSLMDAYHNAEACEVVLNLAKRCNKYIDETAPWALAKDEASKDRLEVVLYNLLECIRILSVLLTPIIPESAEKIKAQLGCQNNHTVFGEVKEYSVSEASPLFARIDTEKVLKEIAEETQKLQADNAENLTSIEQISIEDFAKVELKAAKIVACEPVPKAKKLLKLTVFDGKANRTVVSGIAKWYTPEQLTGRTIILVSNLKPAKLCGVESQGMILAADCSEDEVKVLFIDDVPAGSKIR
ncbi:MAG: methionine--tRNA ligase subunit beta, partial [Clostridia bacterium]|nr:methionine--tRNA ligase subunit beta [Clostridia bacterium]